MKHQKQLVAFYKLNLPLLGYKNDPNSGVSMIDELALIGDKFLAHDLAVRLFNIGANNTQMTSIISSVLCNDNLAAIAVRIGLPAGPGKHATATLLEALVGTWYLAGYGQTPASRKMADDYAEAFCELFRLLEDEGSQKLVRASSLFDHLS